MLQQSRGRAPQRLILKASPEALKAAEGAGDEMGLGIMHGNPMRPSGINCEQKKTMENQHFVWVNQLSMVIFNSELQTFTRGYCMGIPKNTTC